MSYPFYLLMVQYGKAAEGMYDTRIDWLPAAILITAAALAIACVRFGTAERK